MDRFAGWPRAGLERKISYKIGVLLGWAVVLTMGLGLFSALVAQADTVIAVTEVRDELQQDDDCALREAIQTVNSGFQFDACGPGAHNDALPPGPYLISLSANDYVLAQPGTNEDNNATGDLDLEVSVTIQGVNPDLTRVNGGSVDRVLDIDPTDAATVTVYLIDLRLENGLAPPATDGGGIRLQDDTLHVLNSVIDDNTIQMTPGVGMIGNGGGIANLGGTVQITNTLISNNRLVNGSGGGIFNDIGATLTISNSTISGNRASVASGFSSGGGIATLFNGVINIINSTISNNESDGFGGGISNFSAVMNIANSTVTGNRTLGSGGGIRNSGTLSMTHVTITANTADFDGNDSGNGGGVDSRFGETRLKATIIYGNRDNSPEGGTISPDGRGEFESGGYNIIGDLTDMTGLTAGVNNDQVGVDPRLGALIGEPAYFPLLSGSPALDQIPAADCTFISSGPNPLFSNGAPVTFAQNGMARPSNSRCDIGAFEGPSSVFLPLVLRNEF